MEKGPVQPRSWEANVSAWRLCNVARHRKRKVQEIVKRSCRRLARFLLTDKDHELNNLCETQCLAAAFDR